MADDRRRPLAINTTMAPARSASAGSAGSSSSDGSSLKPPRTPRFAEATAVHSPIDGNQNPFSDKNATMTPARSGAPADVGFGYINEPANNDSQIPKSPLKSAMRVPGAPARQIENPLSPTFREEQILEKREAATDVEQAKDLKIKTRVRMAKFALRGVSFSCSLIILSMLTSSFAIFNATRSLPAQSGLPAWSSNSIIWPQIVTLSAACVSLFICILVFVAYCRGGHNRAEKVGVYYTLFAVGWFILSMIIWAIAAAVMERSRSSSNNQDMWGWACVQNHRADLFSDKVDYALVCRLQNWTLICIIIEIVVEVIAITLYSVVFYRYYRKRQLTKSMDLRDKARSDLYLAQLRTQSAPNTPGFGPKSPAFSQYAMSPRFPPQGASNFRSLDNIDETATPFTPGGRRLVEPESNFARTPTSASSEKPTFSLQAPPRKAPSATPKLGSAGFRTPTSATTPSVPGFNAPEIGVASSSAAPGEIQYGAVPIPGAYADAAMKSPPANQTNFRFA